MLQAMQRLTRPSTSTTFPSFSDALSSCESDSYQANDVVRAMVAKNAIFRTSLTSGRSVPPSALAMLPALVSLSTHDPNRPFTVIDFGGNAGYHYWVMRKLIPEPLPIRWHVVETPAMVQAAQELETDELRFFDTIAAAANGFAHVDLIFSSSALQYTPSPAQFLKDLLTVGASSVFITRTPFAEDSSQPIVTVQHSRLSENGPGPLPEGFTDRWLKYPITYLPRDELEQLLAIDYTTQFTLDEGSGVFRLRGKKIRMTSYFFQRN